MKGNSSTIVAIVAVIVLIVAAFLVYRNVTAGAGGGSETVILPEDPRKTDPNFDPNRNRPPELGAVGGPAQGN